MRDGSKNEGGMRELFRWARDLIILTYGMRDSLDGGMRDEKQKKTRCGEMQLLPGGIGIKF